MARLTMIKVTVAAALILTGASLQSASAQSIRIPDFRERPVVGAAMPQGPCDDCGSVRSVREIYRRRDASLTRTSTSVAAPSERVIGAVIVVMPFGRGGSAPAPFVGGVGTPDVQERMGELSYEVTVRMDDGALRTFERREGRQYEPGDRVRVTESRWELLSSTR